VTPPFNTDNPGFSQDEADRYEAAAQGVLHGDLCVFLLRSTLRMAEARGLLLRSLHLDGEPPHLLVQTAMLPCGGWPEAAGEAGARINPGNAGRRQAPVVTWTLKTERSSSRRDLDAETVTLLRDRLAWRDQAQSRATRWDDRYDLVFTTSSGTPITGAGLLQIHQRICTLAGVRRIAVHGLRRTGLRREQPHPSAGGDDRGGQGGSPRCR
jgi:integrase